MTTITPNIRAIAAAMCLSILLAACSADASLARLCRRRMASRPRRQPHLPRRLLHHHDDNSDNGSAVDDDADRRRGDVDGCPSHHRRDRERRQIRRSPAARRARIVGRCAVHGLVRAGVLRPRRAGCVLGRHRRTVDPGGDSRPARCRLHPDPRSYEDGTQVAIHVTPAVMGEDSTAADRARLESIFGEDTVASWYADGMYLGWRIGRRRRWELAVPRHRRLRAVAPPRGDRRASAGPGASCVTMPPWVRGRTRSPLRRDKQRQCPPFPPGFSTTNPVPPAEGETTTMPPCPPAEGQTHDNAPLGSQGEPVSPLRRDKQ